MTGWERDSTKDGDNCAGNPCTEDADSTTCGKQSPGKNNVFYILLSTGTQIANICE